MMRAGCVRQARARVNRVKHLNACKTQVCYLYNTHMLNVLAYLIGLVSLIIVIPAQIPLLGWANWFALPLIVVGAIIGALSSKDGGRNFCLVVLLIAAVRLMLGGGFF